MARVAEPLPVDLFAPPGEIPEGLEGLGPRPTPPPPTKKEPVIAPVPPRDPMLDIITGEGFPTRVTPPPTAPTEPTEPTVRIIEPTPSPSLETLHTQKLTEQGPDVSGGQMVTMGRETYYLPGSTMYELGFRTPKGYRKAQGKGATRGIHEGELAMEGDTFIMTDSKGNPQYRLTAEQLEKHLQTPSTGSAQLYKKGYYRIPMEDYRGEEVLLTAKQAERLSSLKGRKQFNYSQELGIVPPDAGYVKPKKVDEPWGYLLPRDVEVKSYTGDWVRVGAQDWFGYSSAKGKRQFELATKFGIIPTGAMYVEGLRGGWSYMAPPEGFPTFEAKGKAFVAASEEKRPIKIALKPFAVEGTTGHDIGQAHYAGAVTEEDLLLLYNRGQVDTALARSTALVGLSRWEVKAGGHNLIGALRAGVTPSTILAAGYTQAQLSKAQSTATELDKPKIWKGPFELPVEAFMGGALPSFTGFPKDVKVKFEPTEAAAAAERFATQWERYAEKPGGGFFAPILATAYDPIGAAYYGAQYWARPDRPMSTKLHEAATTWIPPYGAIRYAPQAQSFSELATMAAGAALWTGMVVGGGVTGFRSWRAPQAKPMEVFVGKPGQPLVDIGVSAPKVTPRVTPTGQPAYTYAYEGSRVSGLQSPTGGLIAQNLRVTTGGVPSMRLLVDVPGLGKAGKILPATTVRMMTVKTAVPSTPGITSYPVYNYTYAKVGPQGASAVRTSTGIYAAEAIGGFKAIAPSMRLLVDVPGLGKAGTVVGAPKVLRTVPTPKPPVGPQPKPEWGTGWRVVRTGEVFEPGLEFRMDFSTGINWVRGAPEPMGPAPAPAPAPAPPTTTPAAFTRFMLLRDVPGWGKAGEIVFSSKRGIIPPSSVPVPKGMAATHMAVPARSGGGWIVQPYLQRYGLLEPTAVGWSPRMAAMDVLGTRPVPVYAPGAGMFRLGGQVAPIPPGGPSIFSSIKGYPSPPFGRAGGTLLFKEMPPTGYLVLPTRSVVPSGILPKGVYPRLRPTRGVVPSPIPELPTALEAAAYEAGARGRFGGLKVPTGATISEFTEYLFTKPAPLVQRLRAQVPLQQLARSVVSPEVLPQFGVSAMAIPAMGVAGVAAIIPGVAGIVMSGAQIDFMVDQNVKTLDSMVSQGIITQSQVVALKEQIREVVDEIPEQRLTTTEIQREIQGTINQELTEAQMTAQQEALAEQIQVQSTRIQEQVAMAAEEQVTMTAEDEATSIAETEQLTQTQTQLEQMQQVVQETMIPEVTQIPIQQVAVTMGEVTTVVDEPIISDPTVTDIITGSIPGPIPPIILFPPKGYAKGGGGFGFGVGMGAQFGKVFWERPGLGITIQNPLTGEKYTSQIAKKKKKAFGGKRIRKTATPGTAFVNDRIIKGIRV